jgi:hypothetical protein
LQTLKPICWLEHIPEEARLRFHSVVKRLKGEHLKALLCQKEKLIPVQKNDLKSVAQEKLCTKEVTELLDEVVVLGYGANTRKQDLSASVGVVSNTEELAARPVTSTEGMLQGQLAGVTITADGGDPTSSPNIVIRGQGSQDGDNVLWVIFIHQV